MSRLLWIAMGVLALCGSLPAAEPQVMFEDRFEGKLGDGWTWVREDPKTWRFKEGALEIRVEPGVAPTVKNALLRAAPDRKKGEYAVDVTITSTAPPTRQYEQAGITWYRDGTPVFKLVHELIDGKTYIIPGKIPTSTKVMQLRLVVAADRFVAQFRPEGKGEFQTAAQGPLPAGAKEQVSIQCYNGPPDAEHWFRFSDFHILKFGD